MVVKKGSQYVSTEGSGGCLPSAGPVAPPLRARWWGGHFGFPIDFLDFPLSSLIFLMFS